MSAESLTTVRGRPANSEFSPEGVIAGLRSYEDVAMELCRTSARYFPSMPLLDRGPIHN